MERDKLAALIEQHIAETVRLNGLIMEYNRNLGPEDTAISTAPIPSKYSDFMAWREKGIHSEALGLIIAPSDYYECNEIGGRRSKFTFGEAMRINEAILRPNGWRLMSPLEWKMIVKEFSMNGKNYETIRFLKKLGFTPDDDKDVEESRNLTTGHGVGKVVEYWTDQREDSSHAKVIFVPGEKYLKTMRKVCSRKPQIWGYGCLQTEEHAIRCVSLE